MAIPKCNDLCEKHRAQRIGWGSYYDQGFKFCRNCGNGKGIFLKWDGVRCPCCKQILRSKPTGSQQYREKRRIKQSRTGLKFVEAITV